VRSKGDLRGTSVRSKGNVCETLGEGLRYKMTIIILFAARGKIKKYTPLLAGIGVKVVAVLGLLFGGLTLLVTKALLVAKLAFVVATALGVQKLLSGGGLTSLGGKVSLRWFLNKR
jgi:hypothetical protein